jgi:putative glutamine amidotransferase
MQVMNVALGGTLVVDLPTDGFMEHRSRTAEPLSHPLAVVPHTLLHALAGTTGANVNSFHHQAVDVLGQGLVRSAISSDGVTEAAEWAIKDGMSFLLLVQWHPERAPGDALSQNIMKMFLREVRIVHSDYSHH